MENFVQFYVLFSPHFWGNLLFSVTLTIKRILEVKIEEREGIIDSRTTFGNAYGNIHKKVGWLSWISWWCTSTRCSTVGTKNKTKRQPNAQIDQITISSEVRQHPNSQRLTTNPHIIRQQTRTTYNNDLLKVSDHMQGLTVLCRQLLLRHMFPVQGWAIITRCRKLIP